MPPSYYIFFLVDNRSIVKLICKGADVRKRLIQFLATESLSNMMKNAFYITSNAVFVLKIFKFLS